MFVPRKPWPFGNEWKTIACGVCRVLFKVELVEGMDAPAQLKQKYDNLGKTVGLLLRMTEGFWGTAKIVVLDSGFCVLQGLIELAKRGVFAAASIKKRRYWPKHIRGEEIKAHFADKQVGESDAWSGRLDEIPFDIFAMKEPEYVMSMMSTYGMLVAPGKEQK